MTFQTKNGAREQDTNQVVVSMSSGTVQAPNALEKLFSSYGANSPGVFPARATPLEPVPHIMNPETKTEFPESFPPDLNAESEGPTPDLSAEAQWLREERKRLETYTLGQLASITKQREELTTRRANVESTFALKEQDLNRQMKILAERTRNVEQRERRLAENEAAWSLQQGELQKREEYLQELQQTQLKIQKEIDHQRMVAETLRFQVNQLQEKSRSAESEFVAFERALAFRKKSWEEEQATFFARQAEMEKRCQMLDQTEKSLQRRERELDEMEASFRCESEQRLKELAAQFEDLERQQKEIHSPPPTFERKISWPNNSDDEQEPSEELEDLPARKISLS